MNLCRTCKHWSCRSDMIGAGNCLNVSMQLKVITRDTSFTFITAQNFGCTEHEPGPCTARLDSETDHHMKLRDFMDWAKTEPPKP